MYSPNIINIKEQIRPKITQNQIDFFVSNLIFFIFPLLSADEISGRRSREYELISAPGNKINGITSPKIIP